jgi:hypothetical protein
MTIKQWCDIVINNLQEALDSRMGWLTGYCLCYQLHPYIRELQEESIAIAYKIQALPPYKVNSCFKWPPTEEGISLRLNWVKKLREEYDADKQANV